MKKLFVATAAVAVLGAGLAAPAQAYDKSDYDSHTTEYYLKKLRKAPCSFVAGWGKFGTYSNGVEKTKRKPRPGVTYTEDTLALMRMLNRDSEARLLRAAECGYLEDDRNPLDKAAGSFDKIFGSSLSEGVRWFVCDVLNHQPSRRMLHNDHHDHPRPTGQSPDQRT